MAFLSWLGKLVVGYIFDKVAELVRGFLARQERHKEIDKEAEESVKPSEDAKNDKEQEDALKDSIGSGW